MLANASAATANPNHPNLPPGRALLAFEQRKGATRLTALEQRAPLRALIPDDDDPLPLARVTTPAAEKVYRSAGANVLLDHHLSVASNARLEWLPRETILFEGARLRRTLRIDLAAECHLLAAEILVFGRIARGEHVTHGLLHDAWEVRRDGDLCYADTLRLEPPDLAPAQSDPACLAGARAGATVNAGLLLVRIAAADPRPLRRLLGEIAADVRASAGLPPTLPPSWRSG